MKIVADAQIPFVKDAFSRLGELVLAPGRDINGHLVKDADILLIRSVTPINSSLLDHSSVKFVGTATSGLDHIDQNYLRDHGIRLISAHGSNALSVVEYVLSALCVLAGQYDFNLTGKSVGIIGCGAVGGRLAQAFAVLGMHCLLYDPPLRDATGEHKYTDLQDILQADIITLHVPLTDSGPYPTHHLVNPEFLQQLNPSTILINTARGGVIDEQALRNYMNQHPQFRVVLDVWANEPLIDLDLLKRAVLATPHIAGYATDAKIHAATMLYAAVCDYLGVSQNWQPQADWLLRELRTFRIGASSIDDALYMAVLSHYDVRSDAAALRRIIEIDPAQYGAYFDALRKNYPVRREFSATTLCLPVGMPAELFKQLGFNVKAGSV